MILYILRFAMEKKEVQSYAQLVAPAESVKNKHSRFVPVKILIIVCSFFTLKRWRTTHRAQFL